MKEAGHDAKIVHVIHDEIIVEARKEIAEQVEILTRMCMRYGMGKIIHEVLFEVEPEVRETWGEQ